ncbi:hypothetical protein GZH47_13195 [Paenibacillus rhizovicinus]|uniref:DUF4309 domain-containing protein n=1 Tax=Paenibacillus rhizovicinus TaxID=2704463 RepID=A0A6C0NZK6_9BACL|nr:hypothetical protein [Paenibacillus rhizovicinus]QHW31700.1 hypothetical protein GZH47_13195 [Paenibacillus rhizovicinus]
MGRVKEQKIEMRLRTTTMLALVCVILMACMLAGCSKSETPLTYMDKVGSTNLSGEKGGQVTLGIDEQALVKQMGKPIRTLNDGGRSFVFMYEEYQYTSIDNTIMGYMIGPESATAKGLKLGNAKADVVKLYGDDFYTRAEKGSSATIGYIDKTAKVAMEIELKDDLVKNISVTMLSMYE